MKYIQNKLTRLFLLFFVIGIVLSCQYQEVGDAVYPSQKIYLPAAVSKIYMLNDTNQWKVDKDMETSFPISFKYKLDLNEKKLIVPLGVYRSGVNNDRDIIVEFTVNNFNIDSIMQELIDAGAINSKTFDVIPNDVISFESEARIKDGESGVANDIKFDIPYILMQKDKFLVVGIQISSSDAEVTQELNRIIIVIDTEFVAPYPKFSYTIDKENDKKFIFYNKSSSFAKSFIWKFDDEEIETNEHQVIYEFDSYKTHNISFTAIGITGIPVTHSDQLYIWQNITSNFIQNPGNPFLREDDRTSVIGNLADWTITDNLKTTKSGGIFYGGYVKSQKYNDITIEHFMDFFSLEGIENGKIYQSFILPAGDYRTTFNPLGFTGNNECWYVISVGNSLPDATELDDNNSVLTKFFFNSELTEEQELYFNNPIEQKVTLGFIVNTETPGKNVFNEVMIHSVGLYK